MHGTATRRFTTALRAGLLAASLASGAARAAEPQGPHAVKASTRQPARSRVDASRRGRPGLYYQRNWGVDIVGVKRVSSGYMLRFDYRVVDPTRAAALTDRTLRPYLIDEATRTALAIPAMENIGELRQLAPLEENRTYYMIFGNPGGLVRHGSRVTLVVGNLRAEGLVVD
jgi:hypothetical protein